MSSRPHIFFETANRLLAGREKLVALRHKFGRGLHFAIDNDVVMDYVTPQVKHAEPVLALLEPESDFSIEDQAISLTDRISSFILYGAAKNGDGHVFSLPGHHSELWLRLAGGIHRRLSEEVTPSNLTPELTEQIKQFQENFYDPVAQGGRVTINELIAAVPRQLLGWLGIGTAAQEWDRLQQIRTDKVLVQFPEEMVDRQHLDPDERARFLNEMKAARDKWEKRLAEAHAQWLTETQLKVTDKEFKRASIDIRHDATALAYWERLNQDAYPSSERLVLITSSGRIVRAVSNIRADELVGKRDTEANDYLLHPFDFLDECHLHLTGELAPERSADQNGRLSNALRMVADSKEATNDAITEFGQLWSKFLRACVLERVQKENRQHGTYLRRVRFVFNKAGITSDTSRDNPLVVALAERGSDVLSDAAEVRLLTTPLDHFRRSAALLRFNKHPIAQGFQLKSPKTFCKSLTDTETRSSLIKEVGHRYTLHLLQARAFIWAGDWKTALSLCNFSLAICDKLPPDPISGIFNVDGREGTFLAAVCEKYAGRGKPEALKAALKRLGEFVHLATVAHKSLLIDESDFSLHLLRAESERLAIATVEMLTRFFAPTSKEISGTREDIVDALTVENLVTSLVETRLAAARDASKHSEKNNPIIVLIYISLERQCWVNEAQIRLLGPHAKIYATKELLTGLCDVACDVRRRREALSEREEVDSSFVQMVEGLLKCAAGRVNSKERTKLRSLIGEQPTLEGMFEFEEERNKRFLAMTEPDYVFPT